MLRPRQADPGGGAAALRPVERAPGGGRPQPERPYALLPRHEGHGRGVSWEFVPHALWRPQKARPEDSARPRVRGRAPPSGDSRNSTPAPSRLFRAGAFPRPHPGRSRTPTRRECFAAKHSAAAAVRRSRLARQALPFGLLRCRRGFFRRPAASETGGGADRRPPSTAADRRVTPAHLLRPNQGRIRTTPGPPAPRASGPSPQPHILINEDFPAPTCMRRKVCPFPRATVRACYSAPARVGALLGGSHFDAHGPHGRRPASR